MTVLLRRPFLALSYLAFVLAEPRVGLALSGAHSHTGVETFVRRPRYARSHHVVLGLPTTVEAYLRGRSRQAVRTNVTRARRKGLRCVSVAEADRAQLVEYFRDELGTYAGREWSDERWWCVREVSGQYAALGRVVVDDRTAILLSLISSRRSALTSEARYLLHTTIVEQLIADGVGHLLVEGVLGRPPGEQYFAARLGYQPARVVFRSPDKVRGR